MIEQWMLDEVAEYDLEFLIPPETILDIGANVGAYSLRASKLWPSARITAYEPMPDNAAEFRRNCGNGRMTLNECAVRCFGGAHEILRGELGVTASFHDLGRQTKDRVTVECVRAALIPCADLVKIDSEGCEVEILNDLKLASTRALICEYHRASDVEPIMCLARAAGMGLAMHVRKSSELGILKFARQGVLRSKRKLFVGLPVYGGMDAQFAQCLINLHLDPPCDEFLVGQNLGDSLVCRSRNTITANFLATDATHLLWLDSDLVFSTDHIRRLISHNKDVCGGFYPKKGQGPVQWVCNALDGNPSPVLDSGLQEIKYAGTGCLLIARNVFERMIQAYGDAIGFRADGTGRQEYDFWSVGPYQFKDGTRRYLSEDWYFCQRWIDLGGKVWGDTRIICKHIGQATYPLKTQEADFIAKPI